MTIYLPQKTYLTNTTFQSNRNVIDVDCSKTQFYDGNAVNAFHNCRNLKSVTNIPDNITNMYYTFWDCINMNTTPTIPNNVINMCAAFLNCGNITTAPTIPNSVTNMRSCFSDCTNLTVPPSIIPSLVTDMNHAFSNTNITTTPDMSNASSVSNFHAAFYNCRYLTTVTSYPPTGSTFDYAFYNCIRLTTVPNVIPNNIVSTYSTFYNCPNLNNVNIFFPPTVVNMQSCFYNCKLTTGNFYIYSTEATIAGFPTDRYSSSKKNVYFPFTYDNGVYTTIYNNYNNYYGISDATYYNIYITDLKTIRGWNTGFSPYYNGPIPLTPIYVWDMGVRIRIGAETTSPVKTNPIYVVTDYDDGTFASQYWYTNATPMGNISQIHVNDINTLSTSGSSMSIKLKTSSSGWSTFSLTRNTSGDFNHNFFA